MQNNISYETNAIKHVDFLNLKPTYNLNSYMNLKK